MTKRAVVRGAMVFGLVSSLASAVRADVRADEKTHVEFAGMLGRMVNIFGGKAAREGVRSTVAVKGDRKATLNESTGQIIDLAEEKIYDLDLKRKTYRVTTFEELRRRMEEARQKAEAAASRQEGSSKGSEAAPSQQQEPQVEVDFDVKDTGQTRNINGFDTHETIVTITVRQKGKTLEQGGGLVMTSDLWLAPRIAAMDDVAQFDRRYAQKLYAPTLAGAPADQMASAMAMYPMMKPALAKLNAEGGKINGTSILTTMTMDTVKSEDQMAQQSAKQDDDSSSAPPRGLGSFVGGLAKRAAAKKAGGDQENKPRATFMTSTAEVLKVATSVTQDDVAVPAGFKQSK